MVNGTGTQKEDLETRYADQLRRLRAELTAKILPQNEATDSGALNKFLESDALDDKLAQYVVLLEATPRGLAEFAQQGTTEATLAEQLLEDTDLLKQMLVADGANAKKEGRNGYGPAQYGPAMKIYTDILKESQEANTGGVLARLALAISLEHAVPILQANPKETGSIPCDRTIDPVRRYLNYEMAYQNGELDPAFDRLSTWELRMVVNGDEPDETLAWGRTMLRNFRPDHILNSNYDWRYVGIVRSDVRYGSQDVKYDRPELQFYQNILMNGGVCGRRAFIGRFILRAFGIPTTARPSKGHGALAHWTPNNGWIVNLGGGWGCGWTKTRYKKDVDFLARTQAQNDRVAYLKVKRAQWAGDVLGERRIYGEHDEQKDLGFWYSVALRTQRAIIHESSNKAVKPLDTLGKHKPTIAEKVLASPATPEAKKITYNDDGVISIPAAAYSNPKRTRDVHIMTSFRGGLQIYLPNFSPQGQTILRGGTWKCDANKCCSGKRLLSGGYGKYEDWGFRVAVSPTHNNDDDGTSNSEILTLDLGGDSVTMELVYIKPGTFVMGGESTSDGRFQCVEVPKHEVKLTKGYYLGKYPVTQAQYQVIMGLNPSKSTKAPDCPVDNVGEEDALTFCRKLAETTGHDVRLPTEAEWEYASRAGLYDTKWFFGDDPLQLGEYAWFKDNAKGKSHPVGQKKPNPWGLYDIYGNVCERISDKYAKNYYSISPPVDPTGPNQGTKSCFNYKVNVLRPGKFSLTAHVVTVNYNQQLNVSVNGGSFKIPEVVMEMPFTLGNWQDSKPAMLLLKKGENTLNFWRNKPPQYGLVIKDFTLKPVN